MALEINTLEAKCKPPLVKIDPDREFFDSWYGPENPYDTWLEEWLGAIIRSGRSRSKKRGLPYTIDVDYLIRVAKTQGYCCAVSGIPFNQDLRRYLGWRRHPFSPSIDRIDNEKGYEPGNVRLVCLIVNLARSDFGDGALIQMARAIVARHGAQDVQSPALQA